ncbi:zinc-dependent alcohol dehydrogenase [Youxingia wuxianensis]|uniref:Alcohol dehydrogenase catalytic domain-containing protein n=1 Tax=Youxingia wuxianensis TaxID=2763678 RepID=A0A926ER06_9FIRM|nr:alcohol dehydrogenase catalytic domain-containing protein [Youxingia wuxianensis]MBC8585827.1 alcohol dehydrogenase catalytic domain-containing protein [Youxingia wuxianensis]
MKALLATNIGEVSMQEIPTPECGDDDVLIKVEYAGICGSDMHIYHGTHPFRKPPVILGHELSGVIIRKGVKVDSLNIGDEVTAMPVVSCGECIWCKKDMPVHCAKLRVPGTSGWVGTFVEYFNIPARWVYKKPDNIDLKTAVLAEPLSVAIHALRKFQGNEKENLLIIGVGAIGSLAVVAAKAMGFGRIMVSDVSEFNLDLALKSGADRAVNVLRESLEDAVVETFGMEPFGKDKASAVLVTADHENVLLDAVHCLGIEKRVVTISTITTPRPFVVTDLTEKLGRISGSASFGREDFELALRLMGENAEVFASIVSHVFPKEKAQEAFEIIDQKKEGISKAVIKMS